MDRESNPRYHALLSERSLHFDEVIVFSDVSGVYDEGEGQVGVPEIISVSMMIPLFCILHVKGS